MSGRTARYQLNYQHWSAHTFILPVSFRWELGRIHGLTLHLKKYLYIFFSKNHLCQIKTFDKCWTIFLLDNFFFIFFCLPLSNVEYFICTQRRQLARSINKTELEQIHCWIMSRVSNHAVLRIWFRILLLRKTGSGSQT